MDKEQLELKQTEKRNPKHLKQTTIQRLLYLLSLLKRHKSTGSPNLTWESKDGSWEKSNLFILTLTFKNGHTKNMCKMYEIKKTMSLLHQFLFLLKSHFQISTSILCYSLLTPYLVTCFFYTYASPVLWFPPLSFLSPRTALSLHVNSDPCDPSPCLNNGTCDISSDTGNITYMCTCTPRFTGEHCETGKCRNKANFLR